MDQLKPFAIADVNAAQAAYLAKSKQIFGKG
jgi:iron(III) transport system substrate-binding protein